MELYNQLRHEAADIQFGFSNSNFEADILLVLHACPVECAAVPESFKGTIIHVSPWVIDKWATPEEIFISSIIEKLRDLGDKS